LTSDQTSPAVSLRWWPAGSATRRNVPGCHTVPVCPRAIRGTLPRETQAGDRADFGSSNPAWDHRSGGSVWTSCPTCRRTQPRDDGPGKETLVEVIHEGASGCGPILTMTFAPVDPSAARHMRDWAVEHPSALFCRPLTGDQQSIRYPASVRPRGCRSRAGV
jgi:hypothetical protein